MSMPMIMALTLIILEQVINGVPDEMIIDTGAIVTVMSDDVYFNYFHRVESKLEKCNMILKTYTG